MDQEAVHLIVLDAKPPLPPWLLKYLTTITTSKIGARFLHRAAALFRWPAESQPNRVHHNETALSEKEVPWTVLVKILWTISILGEGRSMSGTREDWMDVQLQTVGIHHFGYWRSGSYKDHITPNVLLTGRQSSPVGIVETLANQLWEQFQKDYLPNLQDEQNGWWRIYKTNRMVDEEEGEEKRSKEVQDNE